MTPKDQRDLQLDRDRQWATWALSCWQDFPASATPRPLVIGTTVRVERGFRSRDAKIAFRRGNVIGSNNVPDSVLDVVRQNGTADSSGIDTEPLEITAAKQQMADFITDRGSQSFEAWCLSGPALFGYLVVLEPKVASKRWHPPEESRPPKPLEGGRHFEFRASADRSDRELVVSFIGGPIGEVDYPDAEVLETAQALTVLPLARQLMSPQPRWSAMPAQFRQVEVRLTAPLGGRVLVDLEGSACVISDLGAPRRPSTSKGPGAA